MQGVWEAGCSAVGRAASAATKGAEMSKDYEDQARQRRLDEDWKRVDETKRQLEREWQEERAKHDKPR